MTEYICTCDAICIEQKRQHVTKNPKSAVSAWNGLRWTVGAIGNFVLESYRFNHETQPQFSNGGTRVLIRPDRIELV